MDIMGIGYKAEQVISGEMRTLEPLEKYKWFQKETQDMMTKRREVFAKVKNSFKPLLL